MRRNNSSFACATSKNQVLNLVFMKITKNNPNKNVLQNLANY